MPSMCRAERVLIVQLVWSSRDNGSKIFSKRTTNEQDMDWKCFFSNFLFSPFPLEFFLHLHLFFLFPLRRLFCSSSLALFSRTSRVRLLFNFWKHSFREHFVIISIDIFNGKVHYIYSLSPSLASFSFLFILVLFDCHVVVYVNWSIYIKTRRTVCSFFATLYQWMNEWVYVWIYRIKFKTRTKKLRVRVIFLHLNKNWILYTHSCVYYIYSLEWHVFKSAKERHKHINRERIMYTEWKRKRRRSEKKSLKIVYAHTDKNLKNRGLVSEYLYVVYSKSTSNAM